MARPRPIPALGIRTAFQPELPGLDSRCPAGKVFPAGKTILSRRGGKGSSEIGKTYPPYFGPAAICPVGTKIGPEIFDQERVGMLRLIGSQPRAFSISMRGNTLVHFARFGFPWRTASGADPGHDRQTIYDSEKSGPDTF
jgi:hypothetical protein